MKKSKFDVRRTVEIEGLGKITTTQSTLNKLSIALMEASKYNGQLGIAGVTTDGFYRQSKQIFDILEATGFYKN